MVKGVGGREATNSPFDCFSVINALIRLVKVDAAHGLVGLLKFIFVGVEVVLGVLHVLYPHINADSIACSRQGRLLDGSSSLKVLDTSCGGRLATYLGRLYAVACLPTAARHLA